MWFARLIALLICTCSLNGCAGLFVAGAATTVDVVTDTRSTKDILDDNNIEFEIAGISNKPPFREHSRIHANSFNGTVLLIGQANSEQLSEEIEKNVRTIKGVQKVHNQLRIKQPISFGQISKDSWITTKVKSSLLTDSELNGINIKVITEDGEVFLIGRVTPKQGDIASEIARNISGVKQVIKAFY